MYNQYYQPQQNLYKQDYLQNQYALKGRPVSSFEEARAAQIDFDGSLFVFPDVANNRIYTKQIGMDGTAMLKAYELINIQQPDPLATAAAYVTKEEFDSVVEQLKEMMEEKKKPKVVEGF